MRGTLSPTQGHRSIVFTSAFCVGLLGIGLLGGHALAQPQPPTSTGGAAAIQADSSPQPKRKGKTTPVRAGRRPRRGSSFKMNPKAKWACDKQTVTQGPTWRGAKSLTFEFDIRNDGTEDLRILAKGG